MFTLTSRSPAAATTTFLAVIAALAFAAAAGAATIRGSSNGLVATMQVGTHHPTVGRNWPMKFTATRGGRAAKVTVTYEYLFGGRVVAVRAHHTFSGHFSDALLFPANAVGEPLTFRAAIKAGSTSINLDYPIQVVR